MPAPTRDEELKEIKERLRGDMNAISGGNNGNGWLMQLLQGLILAGIVALIGVNWNTSRSVAEIKATISEREKQNDRDIARLEGADRQHDSDIRRLDSRVTELERGKGAYQPDPNHRQERR